MDHEIGTAVTEIRTNLTAISTKMDMVLTTQQSMDNQLSKLGSAVASLEKDVVTERTHRKYADSNVKVLLSWKEGFWARVLTVTGSVAAIISGVLSGIVWVLSKKP